MFSRTIKVGSVRVKVGESRTPLEITKQLANLSVDAVKAIPGTVGGILGNYGSAGMVGMVALIAILLTIIGGTTLAVKPELTAQLKALPIFADAQSNKQAAITPQVVLVDDPQTTVATVASVAQNAVAKPGNAATDVNNKLSFAITPPAKTSDSAQQQVTNWISKKYRVAGDASHMFVSTAYKTAKETKLDPLLILAVMAIESGFNPFAESPVGAQGLMQVMSKVHHDKFAKFGGVQAAMNPTANIKVGSQILKDYVVQGGSIEAGLKRYVGAGAFATDDGYGYRVLTEYKRLQQVATGKNISANGGVTPIATTPKPQPAQIVQPIAQIPATVVPAEASALPIEISDQHVVRQSKLTNDQVAAL
ncbi:lytic transglycosylase domain-containing protein [Glaciimonas soli]|nr:lytic transglycosylase domain-containing protein [Glaciimonas soli]